MGGGAGALSGGAKSKVATPFVVSGYALRAPREEYSWGLAVDRLLFKKKAGNKADATVVTFAGRAYLANKNKEVLPYLLYGLGYSESHAELGVGGSTRGTGASLSLGAGIHRVKDSRLSWDTEARLLRIGAGLPGLGLGGITTLLLTVTATFRTEPAGNPFER